VIQETPPAGEAARRRGWVACTAAMQSNAAIAGLVEDRLACCMPRLIEIASLVSNVHPPLPASCSRTLYM